MVKKSNHRFALVVPKELYERFRHRYPDCMAKFIRAAFAIAVDSKGFFDQVFFSENYKKYIDFN